MQQDWGRRHAFVALEELQLSSMLRPVFPNHPVDSIEILTAGNCNTNYKFTVRGLKEAFVLRLYVRDRAACRRDLHIFNLVKERVPVPDILHADPDARGNAYTVMSWVEGTLFSDILKSRDESAIGICAKDIGHVLANIGTFTFPQSGFFDPDLNIIEPFTSSKAIMLSYFEAFLLRGEAGKRLNSPLKDQLWQLINDNADLFSLLDGESSLVHSDFKGFNILVKQEKDKWKVSAVLDWEFAFSGSPITDIANMLRYEHLHPPVFESEFIHGFHDHGGQLPQNWKQIAKLVDLLSLCEFLNSPASNSALITEVTDLIERTLRCWKDFNEA